MFGHAFMGLLLGGASMISGVSSQAIATLWLPGVNPMDLVGSVVGSDNTATTYSLGCATSSVDRYGDVYGACLMPQSFTVTDGPSTVAYMAVVSGVDDSNREAPYAFTETIKIACKITDSASGVCIQTRLASYSSVVATVTLSDESDLGAMPVTLAAGEVATMAGTGPSYVLQTATAFMSTEFLGQKSSATAGASPASSANAKNVGSAVAVVSWRLTGAMMAMILAVF